jgi:hypothetical protein
MKNESEYLDEFLRDVRRIFPNTRLIEMIDEYGEHWPVKRCIVCGDEYVGGPESQYCSDNCAVIDQRKHANPSKQRIDSLRRQLQTSWQQATEPETETFNQWLHRFEKSIKRMRERQGATAPEPDQTL